jgi:uncharacterized Ntn-hydrolase superfamily protein
MTFSIVARQSPGLFGLAIASSSPAVAARCAHARRGAGAVATQNITDPALGPLILDAMERGAAAPAAVASALSATPFAGYRQLIAIGAHGPPAVHSGAHALGKAGSCLGKECAAAGNLLARTEVPDAMVEAFESSRGPLAERLLASLRAAVTLGGEAGPIRSAGLLVVREVSWPIIDLRIDWHDAPVTALAALYEVYAPQVEDYVRRALDPASAPTFGVAGDP